MRRVLATELRRSPTGILAPFVFVVLIVIVQLSLRPGVVLWEDATFGLTASAIYINPVLAAIFALAAGRRSSAGGQLRLGASAGRAYSAVIVHWIGLAFWPIGAALLAFAVIAVTMAAMGASSVPMVLWLAAVAAGSGACCAAGYGVGWWLGGKWWVPPAVGIGTYAVWAGLRASQAPYWVLQSFPTTLNQTNPFVRYIEATLAGQLLWYLGLGLTILVVLSPRRLNRLSWLATLIVATIVAPIGLGLIVANNGQVTTGYNPRNYVCGGSAPTVCVLPAFASAIPTLESTFARFNYRVAGTEAVVTRLEHNVPGIGESTSPGAQSLYLEDLAPGYAEWALARYVEFHLGTGGCDFDAVERVWAVEIVDAWLAGEKSNYLSSVGPAGDAARRFESLSEDGRRLWFQANYRRILQCDIQLTDLG